MSAVLHILRKDLRHMGILAALSVAFSLVATLGWYWDIMPSAGGFLVFMIGQVIPVIIQFILVVAIMQADPTVGDRAFWRTRPISPGALLSAKLLFLLVVFAVPSLAVNLYIAASMDAPIRVLMGMVIESTGMLLVEGLVAALVGSMTQSLIQAAAALLAGVVAATAVATIFPDLHLFTPWRLDIPGHAPRLAAVGLYSGAAALILIAHQFATRRTGRTLAFLIVLVPVVLFAGTNWPVTITTAPTQLAGAPSKPALSEGVQIMLIPPAQVWSNGLERDPATGRILKAQTYSINAAARSVPEGRIVQLDSVSAGVVFENGERHDFSTNGSVFWHFWTNLEQATSLCRALGLTPPALENEKLQAHGLRLFSIANEKSKAFLGRRGTLSVTIKLEELAFHEDVSLPARSGASSVHGGQKWSVGKVSIVDGHAVADLRHLRLSSMLITDGAARPDYYWSEAFRHGFVLLNRKRGEFALSADRWNSADTPIWTLDINMKRIKFGDRWATGGSMVKAPMDDAWLEDAELVILHAESAGTFSKTVTLENFQIPQAEDAPDSTPAPFWQ